MLLQARDRAAQLGTEPVSPGVGATLRTLARIKNPRTVVEVGTGTGVSSLYLLAGMDETAVLTTIDAEAEHHTAAKQAFSEAGLKSTRVRTITGKPAQVLPKLADEGYDLVFLDSDPTELAWQLQHAARLLRPGGVLIVDAVLWRDQVADPARRDPQTVAARELLRNLRDDDRFESAVLPTGEGLLVAVLVG